MAEECTKDLGIMRSLLTLALCGGVVYFLGCASTESSRRHADSPEVIEDARQRVLDQSATLDMNSKGDGADECAQGLVCGCAF